MKSDDLDKPLSQSAAAVEELGRSQAKIEQLVRDEVERLIREAQEKNQILHDRNDELVRVKADLDRLHNRLNQLESARSEALNAISDDTERMRTEFQAQLAMLQAELSQKEWTLEERQAEARGREQSLRQEIESLRRRLVESETGKQPDPRDFILGEPRSNHAEDQRFEVTAGAAYSERKSGSFANHRRWHSGFGFKRRWRS